MMPTLPAGQKPATPRRGLESVRNKHKLVTISLPATEFAWLNQFVTTLEHAGYSRTRSAVVRVALAELRKSIGSGPPHEIVKHWLRCDTERLIAAIDEDQSIHGK